MQSYGRTKLLLIATTLVIASLLGGTTDRVFADTSHAELVWALHLDVDMDQCVDVDTLDYLSCGNGQHCTNCYAAVWRISIIIDLRDENLVASQPILHLQVDNPPQLKPPRIS